MALEDLHREAALARVFRAGLQRAGRAGKHVHDGLGRVPARSRVVQVEHVRDIEMLDRRTLVRQDGLRRQWRQRRRLRAREECRRWILNHRPEREEVGLPQALAVHDGRMCGAGDGQGHCDDAGVPAVVAPRR